MTILATFHLTLSDKLILQLMIITGMRLCPISYFFIPGVLRRSSRNSGGTV